MMYYYLALSIVQGFFILVLYYYYAQKSRQGKLVNSVPGPTTVPILGNLLDFNVSLVRLYELVRKWNDQYYPVFRLWFGTVPTVHIRHPDDIEILLRSAKHVNKKLAYEHFYPWLNTGLLTSSGSKWHERRKILTPAFHFNILKKYMDIGHEQSKQAVSELSEMPNEVEIELLSFCSKYTLNVICESAMGVSVSNGCENKDGEKYKRAIYNMGKIIVYRLVRPYVKDWVIHFMPKFKKENEGVLKTLHDFTNKIVVERREYHRSTNFKHLDDLDQVNESTDDSNVYFGKTKRLAMLDLLLSAERKNLIDSSGIEEEVSTFIFEGHDTTSLAMCYTIMLLAENKHVQDIARKEVEDILGPKKGHLDPTDLQEMNYLDRCIKESIRLYPSVPLIARQIDEDLQLKNCLVPKGSTIFLHLIDTHKDPNFWSEPDKFDPDRFLPEQMKQRHPYCYVPFSAGPRNCIGQKFAMMELKSFIATILYDFCLEPVDFLKNVAIQSDVVLRPSHPIHAKFIKIKRS